MRNLNRYYVLGIAPILVLFIIICWDGLNLTNDSHSYLFIAKGFYETGELKSTTGGPVLHWPPAFPILLSPDFLISGYSVWIQGIMTGLFLFLAVQLGQKIIDDQKSTLLYSSIIGFSTIILMISVFLWSEIMFSFFHILALYYLIIWIDSNKSSHLLIFTTSLAVALLTRNAGLFLMPGLFFFGFTKGTESRRMNFSSLYSLLQSGQ